MIRRSGILWGLVAAYWVALFVGTHFPLPVPPGSFPGDKIEHLVVFVGLSALLYLAIWRNCPQRPAEGIVLCIALVYGAVDEWTQALPFINRSCEFGDWMANAAGTAVGVAMMWVVRYVAGRLSQTPGAT